jgi:hypothetical protein
MNAAFDHCVIDIADDTVIYAPAASVLAVVGDSSTWRRWWPDLMLEVYADRGNKGLRWTVSGSLVGSSEIWLEPLASHTSGPAATIVHYYLRATPTRSGSEIVPRAATNSVREQREVHKLRERHVLAWKRTIWGLKDSLESSYD